MNNFKIRFSRFILVFICSLFFCANSIFSQNSGKLLYEKRKNVLKANITSLAFNNYQFQAERVISKEISLGFSFSRVNKANIPFVEDTFYILLSTDFIDTNEILYNMMTSASVSGISIIPEIRIYLGNGFGKGFYLAPFHKYSNFDLDMVQITEFERENGSFENIETNGDFSTNSFGLLFGTQFNLGQRFVLDCYLGPHFGNHRGELTGRFNEALSLNEQVELDKEFGDFILPLNSDTTVIIGNEILKVDTSGQWIGLRLGINLGYRF